MTSTKPIGQQGQRFTIEICPECGLHHLGPTAAWHAMDCSEPELEPWVAQIMGRSPELLRKTA